MNITETLLSTEADKEVVYHNPFPIAVLMVPVHGYPGDSSDSPPALLVGLRNHEPAFGKWGLPGGYVESDPENKIVQETIEEAACRELLEEMNLQVNPELVRPRFSVPGEPGKRQILIFCSTTETLDWKAINLWKHKDAIKEQRIASGKEVVDDSYLRQKGQIFLPSEECSDMAFVTEADLTTGTILRPPLELAFPTHTQAAIRFFKEKMWEYD